jgi:hypothetical protein
MNILIIGHSRSGSTNFIIALMKVLKIRGYGEPYNKRMYPKPLKINFEEDCVVKTLIRETPADEDAFDFYSSFVTKFDTVILLLRRNKQEAVISLTNARNSDMWHGSYRNNISNSGIPDDVKVTIDDSQRYIKKLSDSLNIPIVYYEELYSGDIELFEKEIKKTGLEEYTKELFPHFNPKNRYRQLTKPTKLI